MTRRLVIALLGAVCLTATAQGAPTVAVAKKPSLSCPQTELGDADLQARYATIWERYSVAVDEATKKVWGEIEKQTKSATVSGNLDLALFWKALGKEFEQKSELRWDEPTLKKGWNERFGDALFPAEFSVAVKKASEAYKSAQQGLEKGYGELVTEFTKANKLNEALKVRAEIKELLADKAPASEPAPTPKPEPKPVATAPKNGKYRFVFDDNGWGLLLELQDDTLWVHGDVNPNKPDGILVWPKGPRAMPCRVVGGKVLVDDGDAKANKWRCVINWDGKTGEATYMFDDYKGKSFQKRGKITASSW